VLYSSGDFGVAGNGGQCIDDTAKGIKYNNGTSGRFNPSFPGGCPWVTSVGATQIRNGTSVDDPEAACERVIFSGGGFSNVFAMPKYQRDAVDAYFDSYKPPYSAAQFNNSGMARGFPDVSANGANYVTAVDGKFSLSFGTSGEFCCAFPYPFPFYHQIPQEVTHWLTHHQASAPVFAAMVNMINERRIQDGKGPVGFLNAVLYSNPDVMNDIDRGSNPGCGTKGFSAVPGWDPLTGLGTPDYKKMEDLFLSLP